MYVRDCPSANRWLWFLQCSLQSLSPFLYNLERNVGKHLAKYIWVKSFEVCQIQSNHNGRGVEHGCFKSDDLSLLWAVRIRLQINAQGQIPSSHLSSHRGPWSSTTLRWSGEEFLSFIALLHAVAIATACSPVGCTWLLYVIIIADI